MLNFVRKKNKRFIFCTFFHINSKAIKSFKIYQKGGKKMKKNFLNKVAALTMTVCMAVTPAVPVMPVQAKAVTATTKSTVVKKYVNYSAPKGSGACWTPSTIGYRACVSFIWS